MSAALRLTKIIQKTKNWYTKSMKIKKFGNSIKDLLGNFFLELLLAVILIILVFMDEGLFIGENKKLTVLVGVFFVLLSTIQKLLDKHRSTSENKLIKEAHEMIKKKQKETEAESKKLEEQNDLITRLVKEGLISEKSIYEIIKGSRFYYLFCYQNVPEQEYIRSRILRRNFRNPSLEAVEEIGFLKVGVRHNLYAIPADMLPSKLRNERKIEKLLRKLVKEKWQVFLDEIKEADRLFYVRYTHQDPTNCTYMIVPANFHLLLPQSVGCSDWRASDTTRR